jgi:uncharacterized protein HemX
MIPPFLYKWIAIGVVIIGLSVALFVEHNSRVAAEKAEKAAVELARLKTEDAERWQKASEDRDQVVLSLQSTIGEQNTAIEASKADAAKLRASLDSVRQQNDRLAAEADKLSRDLEEEAAKAPGDVRPLGPIVARRAPALFE